MSEKKKGGLIKGLIIGGAIGSVMSLLLNSKKGKEFRGKMGDEFETSGKRFWKFWKKRDK